MLFSARTQPNQEATIGQFIEAAKTDNVARRRADDLSIRCFANTGPRQTAEPTSPLCADSSTSKLSDHFRLDSIDP